METATATSRSEDRSPTIAALVEKVLANAAVQDDREAAKAAQRYLDRVRESEEGRKDG